MNNVIMDTVPIMTYATGAYKMFDMPKASVWIQLPLSQPISLSLIYDDLRFR